MNAARVVLRAFILAALFTALIFAARALGSSQPPPDAIQALHLNDCQLPCWLGIVPGKTNFDEAVQRVSAAYPQTDTNTSTAIGNSTISAAYKTRSSFGQAVIQVDTDRVVRQITLLTSNISGLMVGDIASFFGTPTCVSFPWPSVVYGSASTFAFVIGTASNGDRWLAPLDNIDIRGYARATNPCTGLNP